MTTTTTRLAELERETQTLAERLRRLEAQIGEEAAVAAPRAAAAAPRAIAAPRPAAAPADRRGDLEDLLGGRVLAWVGGLSVLTGIVFLLAIAVSHGWIGEGVRTLLAGLGSLGLLGGGIWLQERRGRTDAARAATAGGIAAMFATVAVGGPGYGVIPVAVACVLALLTGATATTVAVRWRAQGVGALGIAGAMLTPVLAGAPSSGATLVLLWLAAAAGVGVLVWQRWTWLASAVFVLGLAQWGVWLLDGDPTRAGILLVLVAFGVVNAGAAVGFELRDPSARMRPASAWLLSANAAVLALLGWFALDDTGSGYGWLTALALAHLAIGLATSSTRISRDIRLLSLALGVVLADVVVGSLLDGLVLTGAWALAAIGFALLAHHLLCGRASRAGHDETVLGVALATHVGLLTAQALMQAPPELLTYGDSADGAGTIAIAAATLVAFAAARLARAVDESWRLAFDGLALVGAAYLSALTLDGEWLVAALSAEAAVLAGIAARTRDLAPAYAGAALLATALLHALAFEAPVAALVDGLEDLNAAAVALGSVIAAAAYGARRASGETRDQLVAGASVVALYLASLAVVTQFGAGEDGQLALSALWALVGVAALLAGLNRDQQALRAGALALLLTTIAKVFLFDLATLTSLYRVGSFVVLGLLLLAAAFVWQRLRPREHAG